MSLRRQAIELLEIAAKFQAWKMKILKFIHFVTKAADYFSTLAVKGRLVEWYHDYSHQQKVFSIEAKLKWLKKYKMGEQKNEADMWREFCLVNSTNQTIWRESSKIISTFEQHGWRIKRFRKPERSDVVKALLKWFKQERNDSVSVSGPHLMITFVLPKFKCKLMYLIS